MRLPAATLVVLLLTFKLPVRNAERCAALRDREAERKRDADAQACLADAQACLDKYGLANYMAKSTAGYLTEPEKSSKSHNQTVRGNKYGLAYIAKREMYRHTHKGDFNEAKSREHVREMYRHTHKGDFNEAEREPERYQTAMHTESTARTKVREHAHEMYRHTERELRRRYINEAEREPERSGWTCMLLVLFPCSGA